jgi:hypothetical protein
MRPQPIIQEDELPSALERVEKGAVTVDGTAGKGGMLTVIAAAILFAVYAFSFVRSISPWWFNPAWTTDDALQQSYPFHEIKYPGVFQGDLITEVMAGYLAPLHYWVTYVATYFAGDPIMGGHWVMLLQLVLATGFLFLAVRAATGSSIPAFFAAAWLLHTRHIMQRLTGGLPRGWSACIIPAFLYFVLTGRHKAVLAVLLAGCLLNPPATLIAALAYGLFLSWCSVWGEAQERAAHRRRLWGYVALSPLFALVTWSVVHRPPQVGQMVSFTEASKMPEFQRADHQHPNGRFPFLPLRPAWDEVKTFGFQSFVNRFHRPYAVLRENMPLIVLSALALVLGVGVVRRRPTFPAPLIMFGVSACVIYLLSRLLAFKLYVPDRHIQFPFAFFFIAAFSIGTWRVFHAGRGAESADSSLGRCWGSLIGLAAVGALVFAYSGSGLQATANFNYSRDKKGGVFEWLHKNTPEGSMIAGHPSHIDAVQLFAVRKGYVTTETTHPFYTRYYKEMKRRLEISWRAHFAADWGEFLNLVEPERIDYFVFRRREFTPEGLAAATYFYPLDGLVRELASRPLSEYAYRLLPLEVDADQSSFLKFKDKESAVVDVRKLREYVDRQGRLNGTG